jgi:hypothetical protein
MSGLPQGRSRGPRASARPPPSWPRPLRGRPLPPSMPSLMTSSSSWLLAELGTRGERGDPKSRERASRGGPRAEGQSARTPDIATWVPSSQRPSAGSGLLCRQKAAAAAPRAHARVQQPENRKLSSTSPAGRRRSRCPVSRAPIPYTLYTQTP